MVQEIRRKGLCAFDETEFRDRVERLRAELSALEVDLYLGTMPEHFNYFAGFDSVGVFYHQNLFIRIAGGQPVLLVHKVESAIARSTSWLDDIRVWQHGDQPVDATVEILRELGITANSTIGVESDNWYLKSSVLDALRSALPGTRFVDVTAVGGRLRVRKSPAEIDYIREAARIGDLGMAAALDAIGPGVRDCDVAAQMYHAVYTAGTEYSAFPSIVGSGERSGLFHSLPTERRMAPGEPVMLELSGVRARYHAVIVRTASVGKPSALLKELNSVSIDAYLAGLACVAPGEPFGAVDRATRRVREKYQDYIPARSGMSMDLAYPPVWTSGTISLLEGEAGVFEPGMAFTIQTAIANYRGMTAIVTNTILIGENGVEVLHRTPLDTLSS